MGWRMSVVFRPLFGEQKFINEFTNNDIFKKQGDNKWVYTEYNGDSIIMCHEICDKYPGITFYGYRIEDNTCGQYTYRQLIFNKQDGVFFLGKKYYDEDYDCCPMFDGVCIRGQITGTYDPETTGLIDTTESCDDENGAYCLEIENNIS